MMISRLIPGFISLLILLLTLAACGGGAESPSAELPLAEDDPTLLFFFTDN